MSILITARGKYLVLDNDHSASGMFDNLKEAISCVRLNNQVPVFEWDTNE
jgi:hypothetical protein